MKKMTSMKYVKQIERLMKFVLFSDLVSLTVKMVIDSKDNVKLYFQPNRQASSFPSTCLKEVNESVEFFYSFESVRKNHYSPHLRT